MTQDGTLGLKATLTDVNYNEKLNFNLISLTWLLCSGWSITSGDAASIIHTHGNGGVINFDIMIPTACGAIFACQFVRDADVCAACTAVGTKMNIQKAHRLLGHGDEESMRKTAQELGWILTHGTLKPCLYCAKAKAKQKNVCKESTAPKAKVPGGRVYLDLSKVTVSKSDDSEFELTNKWWKIVMDKTTGKKWSDFTPTKKGMVERPCEFMHKMKQKGIPIKVIRLDPAGENKDLENRAKCVAWTPLQPVDF